MKNITGNKFVQHNRPSSHITGIVVFFMAVIVMFTNTGTAKASLFSFVTDLMSAGKVSADAQIQVSDSTSTNLQNMTLLQPIPNPEPNNCGNISPVNGTILDPDISASTIVSCGSDSTQISSYIVNPGDTISGVANMFNVSVSTILWANDLTSKSVLQTGQTLVILPISGINYSVKKGDTLTTIAKKYGGSHPDETLSDILSYNDVTVNTSLKVGQQIIIPSAELSSNEVASTPKYTKGIDPRSLSTEPLLDNIKNWPSYPSCNVPTEGCYYLRPIQGGHISQKLHLHNAIDLAAPVGTPIRAAAGGTVIISRINGAWNGGYGNFVAISHNNGSQTLYAHLQLRKVVSAGDHVKQGDIIGYIGMTGETFGPHVHFEIRGAQNLFWNPNL